MKRPSLSTPTAHPGESGLSHSAKMRSTFGLRGNCCAPADMPAVHSAHRVATKATRVVGTMGVAPLVRLASALRDVRVPDPLNGRERETFRVTVRQPGR